MAAASVAATLAITVVDGGELGGGSGPPRAQGVEAAADAEVRSAVGARAALGLRADEAYVGDLVRLHRFGDRSLAMVSGMAFTQEEAEELGARDTLRAAVGGIGVYGSTQLDSYAGVYLDQATVVVRFTRDVELQRSRLAVGFVLPQRLRVTEARWTVAEMSAVSQRIIEERDVLTPLGAQLVGAGASPISNNMVATVTERTPGVVAHFSTNYPPGLVELLVGGPTGTS